MKNIRVINAYEVYFRRDGEKKSVLVNNELEARRMKNRLRQRQHRKFLGYRPVKLVEA